MSNSDFDNQTANRIARLRLLTQISWTDVEKEGFEQFNDFLEMLTLTYTNRDQIDKLVALRPVIDSLNEVVTGFRVGETFKRPEHEPVDRSANVFALENYRKNDRQDI